MIKKDDVKNMSEEEIRIELKDQKYSRISALNLSDEEKEVYGLLLDRLQRVVESKTGSIWG